MPLGRFDGEVQTPKLRVGDPARKEPSVAPAVKETGTIAPALARQQDEAPPASIGYVPTLLPPTPPAGRVAFNAPLTDEEGDLLIFLKEVKGLTWKEITKEFNEHYVGRAYTKLQSHYSIKLNKRDRSKDPPVLRLPARYAKEAAVDWSVVHAKHPGPAYARPTDREAREQGSHVQRPDPVWKQHSDRQGSEHSSGAEQASRRERPRRAVPVKNYTWPRRHGQSQLAEAEDYGFEVNGSADVSMRLDSEEPLESLKPAPEKAIAVDNTPVVMEEYRKEDTSIALSSQRRPATSSRQLPYLSSAQRASIQNTSLEEEWDQLDSRNWQGVLIHVDFSTEELDVAERVILKLLNVSESRKRQGRRKRMRKLLLTLADPKILYITHQLRRHLRSRDSESIKAFLQDARDGQVQISRPRIERLAAARPNKDHSSGQKLSTSSMLRQRELGHQSKRGWNAASKPLAYQIKNKIHDTLGPAFSYTGASSDVHTVAWSPDGQGFAGGAICVDDPHSMQYNRANNLLYGDVTYNVIHELGRHSIDRPKTETGPNSTHAMYASQDPKLYKTVSAVAFSPDGQYMFSGGYDRSVCAWETKTDGSQPVWKDAWKHEAEVDMIAINRSGLLATASKIPGNKAIHTIRMSADDPHMESFSSQKATTRPDFNILPTALQFSPLSDSLLLAGFGANVRSDGRDMSGDICIWDVNRKDSPLNVHGSAFNVFDLSFHPRHNWFAVGCVPNQNVNRGIRSVLRLYDGTGLDSKYTAPIELDCRAYDMNDVVWCPGDDFLVAAGCTSGRAYVWDVRMPDGFLRELAHAESLMPLDPDIHREITDTGIRFLSWGDNATRLYTGSSDGVVKVWDVTRSEEDTFVKDLITTDSGIMSGAFSPDKSRLIIGEVNGSINVLEVGREDSSSKDTEKFKYIPYNGDGRDVESKHASLQAVTDSGVATAAELIETEQMRHVPMGSLPIRQAVQGPHYAGPFDTSINAPFLRDQALAFQLKLSRNTAPQCSIPGCADIVKITSEETGDSGRSRDRIPDELRRQLAVASNRGLVPGRIRCACGRPARAESNGAADGTATESLCERCNFACFRCGTGIFVAPTTEFLVCEGCGCRWDVGALGYECVKDEGRKVLGLHNVPRLERFGGDCFESALERVDLEETFGDEGNALTDYYFGLAGDRAGSPPL
ncbi:hypothetical protein P280DRAFT_400431 [Massarina eburnea CBS 473.64]|uniref:WD40 repeat-like protein n=1 Tax=Massarina eburnea CBS 473.64 TaxID=1395130 RepID=A0A6A6S097_9PLEO|nr:hypothetical protein P280DRAFT_400431 [Massarina eburnea CBS 473.64]